jgi:hypothetical protein
LKSAPSVAVKQKHSPRASLRHARLIERCRPRKNGARARETIERLGEP